MSYLVPELAVGGEDMSDEDEVGTTDESGVSSALCSSEHSFVFSLFCAAKVFDDFSRQCCRGGGGGGSGGSHGSPRR